MTTVTRRNVLKSGTALVGGMAGILATGRAPAFAQGTTVHWLRWNDFVPASDQLLRKELLPAAEKALGIKINFETVNGNDLQPRITSAIQSGAGPDIIMLFNNHPQIYSESVVDLSDVASSSARPKAATTTLCKSNTVDGKKWIALPWRIVGAMIAYRKSWFDEVGSPNSPTPGRSIARSARSSRRRAGRSARRSATPSATRRRSATPTCGRGAAQRSRRTARPSASTARRSVESVKFMTAFWKDAHDEGGLAWDDTNNNRAFLSQTICATLNGASIYIESLRNPDKYITEKGAQLKTDILHAPLPKGPAGQFAMHTFFSHVLPSYSKNQKAREGVPEVDPHQGELRAVVRLAEGLRDAVRPTEWEKHKLWDEDPVMAPYKVARRARPARPAIRWPVIRARPPRCSPSTSSPTCTQKPSKACRPRMP